MNKKTSKTKASQKAPRPAARAKGSKKDTDLLDAYSNAVANVVDVVGQAVVGISVNWRIHKRGMEQGSTGSGFLFSPRGYILTSRHLIYNATTIEVRMADNETCEAELVGEDAFTDLAVVRIPADGLPCVSLDVSDRLRVGQIVVAVGNPLGFQPTVTTGVVSALGRYLRSSEGRFMQNIVQHTAPVVAGNPGGPLVNSSGVAIGVNTSIIQGAQGMSFAIPASTAKWVISEFIKYGHVRWGYLGIAGRRQQLGKDLSRMHKLDNHSGVQVVHVEDESPAEESGLAEADVIVGLNDCKVEDIDDLQQFLATWPKGKSLTVNIIRDRKFLRLPITPRKAPIQN